MMLNDNAIDYKHWDNPNELVDRLGLVRSLHQPCNNVLNNEILSIIEELSHYKLKACVMLISDRICLCQNADQLWIFAQYLDKRKAEKAIDCYK